MSVVDNMVDRVVSMTGLPLPTWEAITAHRALIALAPEEHFIWPFFSKYYQHPTDMVTDREIQIVSLSNSPRVLEIRNLLSDEECEFIKKVAGPELKQSTTLPALEKKYENAAEVRTSFGTFIKHNSHAELAALALRVENVSRIPLDNAEDLQAIHYSSGAHYHAHYDHIDREYKDLHDGRPDNDNRFLTVLFYLNDVYAGGETVFPKTNPAFDARRDGYGATVCAPEYAALRVQPRKGNAVMFYGMTSRGQLTGANDVSSLHGGCDPTDGEEKWAANYWLHNYAWQYSKRPRRKLPLARAGWDWDNADLAASQLNFKLGDLVRVVQQYETGWWLAEPVQPGAKQGYVPGNFFHIVDNSTTPTTDAPASASNSSENSSDIQDASSESS
jgi:prolyl 4-hydroxylase